LAASTSHSTPVCSLPLAHTQTFWSHFLVTALKWNPCAQPVEAQTWALSAGQSALGPPRVTESPLSQTHELAAHEMLLVAGSLWKAPDWHETEVAEPVYPAWHLSAQEVPCTSKTPVEHADDSTPTGKPKAAHLFSTQVGKSKNDERPGPVAVHFLAPIVPAVARNPESQVTWHPLAPVVLSSQLLTERPVGEAGSTHVAGLQTEPSSA
jgi:hypothetical protein